MGAAHWTPTVGFCLFAAAVHFANESLWEVVIDALYSLMKFKGDHLHKKSEKQDLYQAVKPSFPPLA